jgi:hypothetical protein
VAELVSVDLVQWRQLPVQMYNFGLRLHPKESQRIADPNETIDDLAVASLSNAGAEDILGR